MALPENRIADVKIASTSAELFLLTLSGKERLGRLSEFELEFATQKEIKDLDDILGKHVCATVRLADDSERHFSGIAGEVGYCGELENNYSLYRVSVRPWLWILTHCSDNRIFQDMDTPEILKKVFQDHGFSDYKLQLSKSYSKRGYCVQYGETDFDFVSRLMEEEGIYYSFEHSDSKHELVLHDDSSKHTAISGDAKISFDTGGQGSKDFEHVYSWTRSRRIRSQKFELRSYDYLNPKGDLKAEKKTTESVKHANKDLARYEYGTLYTVKANGDTSAQIRVDEEMTDYQYAVAVSNSRRLACGKKFDLTDHPSDAEDRSYLIVSAKYKLTTANVDLFDPNAKPEFECKISVMEANKVGFRPQRRTQKSLVRGPQTAIVVGASGEEIHTDEHGRIKVQFHWDRKGKNDENSSCWVRVSQGWAGNGWGMMALPRMGQEVIVDFLEGDPDQPIVTGCVYNKDNKPPFPLPDNKTQSGIRSRSTLKGDAKTFNELRFEDKKGEEEIYMHAENNFKRVVENNDELEIGLAKGSVAKDEGNQKRTIRNKRTVIVKESDDELTLEKGNQTEMITQGDRSIEVKAGSDKLKVGKKINIEAGDELTIKVGAASMVMKKNGDITFKGLNFKIAANAKFEAKANAGAKIESMAMAELKGLNTTVEGQVKADVKGGAMATLKGGVTMIG